MRTFLMVLVLCLVGGCCEDYPPCPDADGGDTPDVQPDVPEPQCSESFTCGPDPVNCNCSATQCEAVMYFDVPPLTLRGTVTVDGTGGVTFGNGLRRFDFPPGSYDFSLELICNADLWTVITYIDGIPYVEDDMSLGDCADPYRLAVQTTVGASFDFAPICSQAQPP